MIQLSGVIESGNYAFAGHPARPDSPPGISLIGDTEIRGGNFVLARITTNGFKLTLAGGNCRGLRTRTNPGDAWAKQDAFVWQRKEPLGIAEQIRGSVLESAGEDGLTAWNFAVNLIIANPAIDQVTWNLEQTAWGAKTGIHANRAGRINMVLPSMGLQRLIQSFLPGGTFADVKNLVLTWSADAWAGKPTQTMETLD